MRTIILRLVLDLFCVLIRLYARHLQKSRPNLSDSILICGFVRRRSLSPLAVKFWAHLTRNVSRS
jgi:hypothetical protein